ncbi:MAG: flagellar basal body P-ring formation chaperone FlgA [Planctomycetes bacterium]|nr:flagellar basal body P-ring formation chaperone FlgA [Planctomycetota bacterium]
MHLKLPLILAAVFLAGHGLHAAELRIRPECRPSGSLVVLGDVAEIYAQDKEQVEKLAGVELFPAPGPDLQRFLRVRELLEILALRSIDLADCRISGASLATIHGPDVSPPPTMAPQQTSPPSASEPEPVVFAVAAIQPLQRGQVIQAGDVQLVPVPADRASHHLLHEVELAVGQETSRSFRPGQPIDPRGLRNPILVRRRDAVHVTVFAPGVRLMGEGVAMDEGAAGDWIAVETPHSPEKLRARVVGPKQVEIYVNVPAPK